MYVPVNSLGASQDHPICQTYIDTVLRGCLKWGGESLAEEVREIETERERDRESNHEAHRITALLHGLLRKA
jgi:hypothetical protein